MMGNSIGEIDDYYGKFTLTDPCLNFHYRKGELVLALKRLARGCFNIEMCSCAGFFIGDPCETIL